MQTNKQLPAFPVPLNQGQGYHGHAPCDGMTMRDYFAAKAMQAMIAQYPCQAIDPQEGGMAINQQALADDAYDMADQMMVARES